ncbi:MAG: c-type cytochrome [Alphaproteobacteria bacterium]
MALFAATLAVAGHAHAAGDPAAGREKAKVCRTCHGMDGVGKLPHVPNIGGESDFYLTKQLKAFRKGDRRDEQMAIIARDLSDQDIADLAAYFASIEFTVKVPD